MLHHLKSAFRYLNRNRIATTINVTGLAVALSTAFLMLQYLDFELSYDTYLPEHGDVYRITTQQSENGAITRNTAETYYGVADWVTDNFPEVKASTRFYRWPANTGVLFEAEGNLYNEKNYLCADKGFFLVFPSMLISGDAKTCLADPNALVISERLALKIFGTTDVIGKHISDPEQRNQSLVITGIIRHTPANSHFDVDVVRHYAWTPSPGHEWKVTVWTYVRLAEGTSVSSLEKKINKAVLPMLNDPKVSSKLSLQPLASIHLTSNLEAEIKAPGNILYLYIVVGAMVLIMVIAWINYINLETARFIRRLKEVGIRRIIGSSKGNLFARFFTEYACVTVLAVVLAVAIVWTVFPYFGYVTGLPLTKPGFFVPELWAAAIAAFVIATLVAGTYPFISVIRLNPIASLRGRVTDSLQGIFVRRSLLTFQFVASLTLMALVVTASLQLDFMRKVNLNFNSGRILTVYNPANYTWLEDSLRKEKNETFRDKLLQVSSIDNLTVSSAIPGEPIGFTYTDLAKRSMSDPDRQIPYKVMYIDYDFIPLFGLELLAGRTYSPEFSDELCLVVTETTARKLGFSSPEEALNQQIYFIEDKWEKWTIIGIVKDYRHESVKAPVNPGIFRLHRNRGQMVYYSIKLNEHADAATALPMIEDIWKETWPGKPFDYFFIDKHYDQQYKSEIHFSRVFGLFSGIAVFVACLGVMGMSLFEANARMKEISIRKVLGAEVMHIITLLTKDSLRLLIVSFVIALPLVYFLSSQWLTEYPERIGFSVWFLAAPLGLMIALVGVVSLTQVVKAALRNPVESLKQE